MKDTERKHGIRRLGGTFVCRVSLPVLNGAFYEFDANTSTPQNSHPRTMLMRVCFALKGQLAIGVFDLLAPFWLDCQNVDLAWSAMLQARDLVEAIA